MTKIQKLRKIIENVSDAFHGSYVGRNEEGVLYRELYEKNELVVGKHGMIEDKKNLA